VKELGMDSVAITEHGNLHSIVKKYQLAKKAGVKLIFGAEVYIVDDMLEKNKGEKRYHLVLLAKDIEGYRNLIKLVSIANSDGFYYRPRVDKKLLKEYSKGLLALSACIGNDIAQCVINDDMCKCEEKIQEYIDIFGKEDFYLEVERHGIPEEDKVRAVYPKLAEKYGLKMVATCDSHYLTKEDAKAHEVMLCIQTNNTMDNPDRFKFTGKGFHVMSETEMKELFSDIPQAIENTYDVAKKCNVELELDNHIFPNFEVPEGMTHEEYLTKLCSEFLEEKYKDNPLYEKAKERMNFEISVICKMKFPTYFLIVYDFIKAAKEKCQVGPGRGSGAGSIVAYLLGITQLEPLSLGLLFERFLNPDRISLPDFDVDFGDKDIALNYVKNKYGKEKIALIGTFGTMSAKAVLKDVSRAFGIPFAISNEITKHVKGSTIKDSLDTQDERNKEEALKLREYERQYPDVFDIAKKLEGCVRHRGIHACGVVWGKKSINDYVPTYRKGDLVVTQVDGPEVESAGLVKFDFLGLETLNITKNVLDMIGQSDKWLEEIPLDDPEVYKMLQDSDSVGTFQMESQGMQKTLNLVKPTCFDDIIAILALYRPGSMDFIDVYAKRKEGKEKFEYVHPNTVSILGPTYGILVYQEQVMQLSRVLANFTMGESDVLRKAIGKKKIDLMNKMENQFKEGCINHSGMSEKVTKDLWDNIVKFASYSFNKSHAAAYALIAYRTAYLKHYYPFEFMTSVISSNTDNPEKMTFYIESAKSMGLEIVGPEINLSRESFIVEKGHKGKRIRFGLSGIKNVGGEVLHDIMAKRPYTSYQDFINKVDISKVNKRVLRSLISVGCFDNLQHNRAQLMEVYENIKKESTSSEKQMTLFGGIAKKTVIPDMNELSLRKKIEMEIETLGVGISGSYFDLYGESKNFHLGNFENLRNDSDVELFGLIKRITRFFTKKGDEMAFITIYNKRNTECRVVIFPSIFEEELLRREIRENMGVLIIGKYKEDRERGDCIIAEEIRFPKMLN